LAAACAKEARRGLSVNFRKLWGMLLLGRVAFCKRDSRIPLKVKHSAIILSLFLCACAGQTSVTQRGPRLPNDPWDYDRPQGNIHGVDWTPRKGYEFATNIPGNLTLRPAPGYRWKNPGSSMVLIAPDGSEIDYLKSDLQGFRTSNATAPTPPRNDSGVEGWKRALAEAEKSYQFEVEHGLSSAGSTLQEIQILRQNIESQQQSNDVGSVTQQAAAGLQRVHDKYYANVQINWAQVTPNAIPLASSGKIHLRMNIVGGAERGSVVQVLQTGGHEVATVYCHPVEYSPYQNIVDVDFGVVPFRRGVVQLTVSSVNHQGSNSSVAVQFTVQ